MIVVVGEALVDLVAEPGGVRYAARPGGGPANTAVALARLGVPASLLARIADDAFGRLSRARLADAGVDLSQIVGAGEPHALAVADAGPGGTSYRFYLDGTDSFSWRPGELPDVLADDVEAVHAGSLALLRAPGVEELLAREAAWLTIVVDPNVRPGWAPPDEYRAALGRWLELADVMKVSADDLALLAPGTGPEEVARSWLGQRPSLVVVTLGADGALGVGPDGVVRRAAVPVEMADTVGAGDAFGAGLLAGLRGRGRLRRGDLASLGAADLAGALDAGLAAASDALGTGSRGS